MEFNFGFDLSCDHWQGQDIRKVFGQVSWVYALDLATSQLGKLADVFNLAFIARDRDDVDSYAGLLGNLANALVELVDFCEVLLCFSFIKSSKTDVCQAISAHDYC